MNGNIWNWKNSWPLKPIDWMIFFCYFLAFDQIQKTKLFKPENFEWKWKMINWKFILLVGRIDRYIGRNAVVCFGCLFVFHLLFVCSQLKIQHRKNQRLYIFWWKKKQIHPYRSINTFDEIEINIIEKTKQKYKKWNKIFVSNQFAHQFTFRMNSFDSFFDPPHPPLSLFQLKKRIESNQHSMRNSNKIPIRIFECLQTNNHHHWWW